MSDVKKVIQEGLEILWKVLSVSSKRTFLVPHLLIAIVEHSERSPMHNYEIGPVTDPAENVCYCTTVQASNRLHKILLMACLNSYVTGTSSSPCYSCLKLSMA